MEAKPAPHHQTAPQILIKRGFSCAVPLNWTFTELNLNQNWNYLIENYGSWDNLTPRQFDTADNLTPPMLADNFTPQTFGHRTIWHHGQFETADNLTPENWTLGQFDFRHFYTRWFVLKQVSCICLMTNTWYLFQNKSNCRRCQIILGSKLCQQNNSKAALYPWAI